MRHTAPHHAGKAAFRLMASGLVFCLLTACATQTPPPPPPPLSPPVAPAAALQPGSQKTFASPQDAVDALVAATRGDRKPELLQILGPDGGKLISSGDKAADQEGRQKFLAAYDKAHAIQNESDAKAVLVVGEEQWPLPIPLVRANNGWRFDTASGAEEILNRRIGRNELNVVEVCRAYVEAQQEFASLSPTHEFAQRFRSRDGQHDGLYWSTAEGQTESPLGSLIADATESDHAGAMLSKHAPYHGYFYRILKAQGPHASGGAKDYVVNGHMTGGFALIAFPARYGDSGVMTFIVGHNGIVYEKNLGADTARRARAITQFDPDNSWNVVR